MLSLPREEAGGLSVFANHNQVSANYDDVSANSLGVWVPRREQQRDAEIRKWSYDVDERRLKREEKMEATRMRSIELEYRLWYGIGLESSLLSDTLLSLADLQLADFQSTLAEVSDEIWSEDVNLQLHATTQIEKLLSIERECATTLVKNGVVRRLVRFLEPHNFSNLQVEAAGALIKIFCGTCGNTKAESVREAVPCLVTLLSSSVHDVCEQAVFSLGIVAADSPKYRDLVLRNGVTVPLLEKLKKHADMEKHAKLPMLRNLTWTLSILCEDISKRFYKQLKLALPTLERLLHFDDMEVLINSCWAIYGLSSDIYGKIDPLMDAGLCPKLVELLSHTSRWVQIPVLMIVVLITFHRGHIQALIDNEVLRPLWTLLTEDHKDKDPKDGDKIFKREACRLINGILRGNEHQIQAVINAGFFDHLMKLLTSPDMGLQDEAAQIISKAACNGSPKQIKYLVDVCKIINPICNLLSCPNPEQVAVVVQVLEKVLVAGTSGRRSDVWPPRDNPYIELIVKTGCVEQIDKIWMGEIESRDDDYESAAYIMYLLGFNDNFRAEDCSKIDVDELY